MIGLAASTFGAVAAAAYAAMHLATLPALRKAAGGLTPFDLRVRGYSEREARALLAALGPAARQQYLGIQATLDALFLATCAAALVLAYRDLAPALWLPLSVLPVGAALADAVENARVARLLRAEPVTAAAIRAASRATQVKFALYLGAFAVLAWLLLRPGAGAGPGAGA